MSGIQLCSKGYSPLPKVPNVGRRVKLEERLKFVKTVQTVDISGSVA